MQWDNENNVHDDQNPNYSPLSYYTILLKVRSGSETFNEALMSFS